MQAANAVTSEHSQRPAATRGEPGAGGPAAAPRSRLICDVAAASPERR